MVIISRTSACVIDGFAVTGGLANQGGSGGMFTITSSGTTIFRSAGGGLYSSNSSYTLGNCKFIGNTSTGTGGGVYNVSTVGAQTINNCTFSGNTAGNGGAGMYFASQVGLVISNCNFSANTGGGLFLGPPNTNNTVTSINKCTFSGNTSINGGGINFSTSPINPNTISISNSTISGNTAGTGGGVYGMSYSPTAVTLQNCAIYDNIATGSIGGGGVYLTGTNSLNRINNCTFYNNKATAATAIAGGLEYDGNGGGSLVNCIFWNNITPNNSSDANREEIYKGVAGSNVLTVNKCIVRDYSAGAANNYTATNAPLTTDPLFVNTADPDGPDNIFRTADDGLMLRACSQAINYGITPTPATPTDIVGNNRVGGYDAGAYEYQPTAAGALPAADSTVTNIQSGTTNYGSCGSDIASIQSVGAFPVGGTVTAMVYVKSTAPAYNTQPYVRRYYDISPVTNPTTATATVTLYFTQADFTDYNNNRGTYPALPDATISTTANTGNVRITQQHGTSTTGAPGSYSGSNLLITPTSVTYNATLTRWEVTFPVTGFSGFFAHTGASTPLPVKLLSFTAAKSGTYDRIDWATAMEDGAYSFEVERSSTGSGFGTIGTVSGKGRPSTYTFYDEQPLSSINYYRLKMTDAAGAATYSTIAVIRSGSTGGGSVTVAPVPAGNTVTITNTDATLTGQLASIYSMQGRVMTTFSMASVNKLDISTWPAGIYTLHLPTGEAVRIVKQ